MKVAVLMGGGSKERDISLKSGQAVSAALRRRGYEVVDIDVGSDVGRRLEAVRPEVAFIALHGRFGEDGTIQGMLEIMGIPYTGSGVTASAIGMDKVLTKRLVASAGVHGAPDEVWVKGDAVEPFCAAWSHGWPAVIKPACEGSSLGMTVVSSPDEMRQGIAAAARFDPQVIVETLIRGREITVGLLEGASGPESYCPADPLPPLEVIPAGGIYDYRAKYTPGQTLYQVPAALSPQAAQSLEGASLKVWSVLHLSGFARIDFILPGDSEPVFLEVNTIPGFTELSLVPKAAAAVGIGFDDLVERILKTASLKTNAVETPR